MSKANFHILQATGGAAEEVGAAGAEAVIATLEGLITTPENPTVQLDANVPITTVGEDTEVIVRIRRTGLTGTEVEKVTVKPGASAITNCSIQGSDNPGDTAGLKYVVTMASVAKKQTKAVRPTLQATF